MDQSQVEQFVDAAITKNNETLLRSMQSILDSSLPDIKRANSDTDDSHLREIKKLKFQEPRRFKKKANKEQCRFNSKLTDVLDEAKSYPKPGQGQRDARERPIPTIDVQFRNQTKPGCCFACSKPGHWRAQCPLLAEKSCPGQ